MLEYNLGVKRTCQVLEYKVRVLEHNLECQRTKLEC